MKKTGVSDIQAAEIIDAINVLRLNSELGVSVSTRTTLMIGEMVAAGGTLRQGIITSLQTNKEVLESIRLSLQMEKGYLEKGELVYLLFTNNSRFQATG